MDNVPDRASSADRDQSGAEPPRFGSYIGLFYVIAIVGVLSFALLRGSGTGDAFDRLAPGMTPTEVAALLGAPREEVTKEGRLVQSWRIPDGQRFVVEFRDGRMIHKRKSMDEARVR